MSLTQLEYFLLGRRCCPIRCFHILYKVTVSWNTGRTDCGIGGYRTLLVEIMKDANGQQFGLSQSFSNLIIGMKTDLGKLCFHIN